jgi:hypothetical protein
LLIHRFCKKYCDNQNKKTIDIVFDKRTTKYSLNELKEYLNNHGAQSTVGLDYSPFKSLSFADSKCPKWGNMLQINDLLLGAVGYHKNLECYTKGTKLAKKNLANHIGAHSGIGFLGRTTPSNINAFTIWNFKLRKK